MRNIGLCIVLVASLAASCGEGHPPTAGNAASPARLESPAVGPPSVAPIVSADPQLLSNTKGSFAFRHPAAWKFTNCENYRYAIGFSYQDGICPAQSGGGFDMLVMSVDGDQRSAPGQRYIWIGTIDTQIGSKVDGVDGTRISAHVDKDPGMGPEAGTTQTMYDVYNGTRTYLALYQHHPGRPDYTSAFDDVIQQSFRFAPWNAYHSERWDYTVDYPASWFDQGNLGAPDTQQYFANEEDLRGLIGMDSAGVFLALSTVAGSCPPAPPGNVDNTAQLTVDGQTITRVSGFLGPPQSEVAWGAYASVRNGANCFQFAFIFGSKTARDANLRTADRIITSFTTP